MNLALPGLLLLRSGFGALYEDMALVARGGCVGVGCRSTLLLRLPPATWPSAASRGGKAAGGRGAAPAGEAPGSAVWGRATTFGDGLRFPIAELLRFVSDGGNSGVSFDRPSKP